MSTDTMASTTEAMHASTRSPFRDAVTAHCKPYLHAIAIIISDITAAAKSGTAPSLRGGLASARAAARVPSTPDVPSPLGELASAHWAARVSSTPAVPSLLGELASACAAARVPSTPAVPSLLGELASACAAAQLKIRYLSILSILSNFFS